MRSMTDCSLYGTILTYLVDELTRKDKKMKADVCNIPCFTKWQCCNQAGGSSVECEPGLTGRCRLIPSPRALPVVGLSSSLLQLPIRFRHHFVVGFRQLTDHGYLKSGRQI